MRSTLGRMSTSRRLARKSPDLWRTLATATDDERAAFVEALSMRLRDELGDAIDGPVDPATALRFDERGWDAQDRGDGEEHLRWFRLARVVSAMVHLRGDPSPVDVGEAVYEARHAGTDLVAWIEDQLKK